MKDLAEKELLSINGGAAQVREDICRYDSSDGRYWRCVYHYDNNGDLRWSDCTPCSPPIAGGGDGSGGYGGGFGGGIAFGGDAYSGGSGTISNGCGNGGGGPRSHLLE